MYTGVYDILFINHIYFKKNMTKYKINPSKTEQNEVSQDEKLEQKQSIIPYNDTPKFETPLTILPLKSE